MGIYKYKIRQTDAKRRNGGQTTNIEKTKVSSSGSSSFQYFNLDKVGDTNFLHTTYPVVSDGDIIAYGENEDPEFQIPVAAYDTFGLVKYDNTTIKVDENGRIYAAGGGGGGGSWGNITGTLSDQEDLSDALSGKADSSHTHAVSDISTNSTNRFVTDSQISNWNAAYSNNHTHSNKSALDGITATLITNWNTAYTNNHTHSNKAYLDTINQSLGTGNNVQFARVTSTGDVIAYGSASATSTTPVATNTVYGLAKYDNSTIKKNSSGQLYAVSWTGGTVTDSIYKATGDFLSAYAGGANFIMSTDYTDAYFYVSGKTGTADKHFMFYRGATKLCQMGATYMYSVVSWTIGSDMRLKTKVRDLTPKLEAIKEVDTFVYTRNDLQDDSVEFVGLSAQQWKEVEPALVREIEGTYTLDYNGVLSCVIKAIQELSAKIESLESEINTLKGGSHESI